MGWLSLLYPRWPRGRDRLRGERLLPGKAASPPPAPVSMQPSAFPGQVGFIGTLLSLFPETIFHQHCRAPYIFSTNLAKLTHPCCDCEYQK